MVAAKRRQRAPSKLRASPTALYVRGLDARIVTDFKRRAGSRGLSYAQYVTKLVELHARMLDADDPALQLTEMLSAVGLGRIEA